MIPYDIIGHYSSLGFFGKILGLLISLIFIVIGAAISALFLWLSTKIFKIKKATYKNAFRITLLLGAIGFASYTINLLFSYLDRVGIILAGIVSTILGLLAIFLSIWLVKQIYRKDWGKTFLVWIVLIAMSAVVYGIVMAIILFILFILGIAAYGITSIL